jgi:hypothetical protein
MDAWGRRTMAGGSSGCRMPKTSRRTGAVPRTDTIPEVMALRMLADMGRVSSETKQLTAPPRAQNLRAEVLAGRFT